MLQSQVKDEIILSGMLRKNKSQECNILKNIFLNLLLNMRMFPHYWKYENILPIKCPLSVIGLNLELFVSNL